MNTKRLIKDYLETAWLMQLATVRGGQPWVCTVYFVTDEVMNLYWLSWPERRHSQELAHHNKAAAAIVVHDGRDKRPVVGIQAEGIVSVVHDQETIESIAKKYASKYGHGKQFYERYRAGTNRHHMYTLVPQKFVLFDERHFSAEEARTELLL